MTKPLVIYHGNCADGFGAAWALRHAFKHDPELSSGYYDPEFFPGVYQKDPPATEGRDVFFVDFCYKLPVMQAIAEKARIVYILDHHKSAMKDCQAWAETADNVHAVFDMERSGARIAWDWGNGYLKTPKLIDHIEDRDLWRFNLPDTREIQMAVFSYPYDFAVWDDLMRDERIPELVLEGKALHRKHMKDINELIGVLKRRIEIGGHSVPAMSVPYMMVSEAGHIMAEGEPFAACYWGTEETRVTYTLIHFYPRS